jgi:hypothetical protein
MNETIHIDPQIVSDTVNSAIERYETLKQKDIERYKLSEEKYRNYLLNHDLENDSDKIVTKIDCRLTSIPKITSFYDEMIRREKDYYSTVRIVKLGSYEIPTYVLVYGDVDDATVERGTGPFHSIETAQSWFVKMGR